MTKVTRRLRSLALDELRWENECERIFSICPDPEQKDDPSSSRTESPSESVPSRWEVADYFQLYVEMLRPYEPHLGWWIPAGDNLDKAIIRCMSNKYAGSIVTDTLQFEHVQADAGNPDVYRMMVLAGTRPRLLSVVWPLHCFRICCHRLDRDTWGWRYQRWHRGPSMHCNCRITGGLVVQPIVAKVPGRLRALRCQFG